MLLLGALLGCTRASTPPHQTDIPTVVVDFTAAAQAGKPVVVQVPVGGVIVISFSGPAVAELESKYWNASIADPKILTFEPANGSGRAATEPLFTAVKKGETTAVLTYTYPHPHQQVTFEVTAVGT